MGDHFDEQAHTRDYRRGEKHKPILHVDHCVHQLWDGNPCAFRHRDWLTCVPGSPVSDGSKKKVPRKTATMKKPPAGEGDSPPLVSPRPVGERLDGRVEEAGSQQEDGSWQSLANPESLIRWRALSVLYVQPQRLLVAYTLLVLMARHLSVDN